MDITAAQNTPEGYSIAQSGSFRFNTTCKVREKPLMSDTGLTSYNDGQSVTYSGKEKRDGHFWLSFMGKGGVTFFVPYANLSTGIYFGTDSNAVDPIKIEDDQPTPMIGVDTGVPKLSGVIPESTLADYDFPMSGWVTMSEDGAQVRSKPTFFDNLTDERFPKDHTHKIRYVGKTAGSDRMWVKLGPSRYLPIGKLSTLGNVIKMSKGGRFEKAGYVTDQNSAQPWEQIWPYTKTIGGTKTDKEWHVIGDVGSPNTASWETANQPIKKEIPSTEFQPSSTELKALKTFNKQVTRNAPFDAVYIAYIADTHIDSYQTPASAEVLHSMMLMSDYAKKYGVDLMIHGGDLNDGAKPHDLSKIDIQLGVDAMKLGQRPYIILQGNHDDNSGYVRDQAGYQLDQLMTNEEAWRLRAGALNRPDNGNNAVYGTYNIPNSQVTIIVLDGFDQPDIETRRTTLGDGNVHFDSFRHGYSRYSDQQLNWLKNEALPHVPEGNKVLFLNHIALGGIKTWQNTWSKENQLSIDEYARNLFENNVVTNRPGFIENQQVLKDIINYQNATHNVIGYISGHTHQDNQALYHGIQFVTTTCAIADRGDGSEKNFNPQNSARNLTDLTSNAWSIFRISAHSGEVAQFRFGWKNDRYFLPGWHF